MRRPFLVLLALFVATAAACAHPVAQGSMEITIAPAGLTIHARVANEQAFVAEALSAPTKNEDESLDKLWPRHGAYLLQHLHPFADDIALTGEVTGVTPPETTGLEGRIGFELHYPWPADRPQPAKIELRQDVLNEFEFAPGNRWEATYVVRARLPDGQVREGLLLTSREPLALACTWSTGAAPAQAPQMDRSGMFAAYFRHGVMHIMSGYDHLLFMAALVLAVVTLGDLVKVVTAFTVAHTITLTLAVLNLVRLPPQIVEPMIAASIVVVALQNIFWPRHTRGWARLVIAFGFGLFHGLGFAGGLLDAMSDLPGVAVAIAITAFSLGVEVGHQLVVLPIFSALQLARRAVPPREAFDPVRFFALRFGSAAVCLGGVVYLVAALRFFH